MLSVVKETVKKLLGAKDRPDNLLCINVEKLETRVALLENGVLEEYSVERTADRNIVGGVFKGRVRNIEHGLKAMFVDIGFEKNAFLHFWDALPAALDSNIEEISRAPLPPGGASALDDDDDFDDEDEDEEDEHDDEDREDSADSHDNEASAPDAGDADAEPVENSVARHSEPDADADDAMPGEEPPTARAAAPEADRSTPRPVPAPREKGRSRARQIKRRRGSGPVPVPAQPIQLAKKRPTVKDIPDIYPVGSEVIVQVTKGPIGTKGPRVTTNLSLPGRYLVLMPFCGQSGISRKIEDPKERDRLRKILRELELPEGMGVILRTVGEGQRARYFVRDLSLLLEQWRTIEERLKKRPAPACLFEEPDLIERTVRDFLTDEIGRVVCDDAASVSRMQKLVGQISRRSQDRIEQHEGPDPVFEKFKVEKQIEDAYHRQVWLPCGGYLVLDETEALIAIDVNTGRNKGGGKDMEKTILQTNLEAADEIARQLRLRNVGGLIICDFIDMKHRRDQQQVYERMKERLKRDKAKTHILPISALGLMEMTRQRAQESISSTMFITCPHCLGRGVVKSPESLSVELQRKLKSVMRKHRQVIHDYRVIIHPEVLQRLRSWDEDLLIDLERRYEARLTFRSDPHAPLERLLIMDGQNNVEVK